jgi:phage gp36-like protein
MPYANKQDMIERFGEAELIENSNKGQAATSIKDSSLNLALSDADAEINAYLAVRYVLPLANPPAILVNLACQIARYNLFGPAVTDEVRDRYRNAAAFLKNVSDGKATLGPAADSTVPPASGDSPKFSKPDPVFTKNSLKDYLG